MSSTKYGVMDDDGSDGLPNGSDSEEDINDETETLRQPRPPIATHKQDNDAAEDEVERPLLSRTESPTKGSNAFPGHAPVTELLNEKKGALDGRRKDRRKGRRRKREGEEETELIYKVEEGGRSSSSARSSGNSSEMDLQTLQETPAKKTKSKASRVGKFAVIHLVIVVAFLALLYGAYRASRAQSRSHQEQQQQQQEEEEEEEKVGEIQENVSKLKVQTLSNGTHNFAPTTILISLDGFRADFLYRGLTPTLSSFVQQGVSPKHMLPSFPSLTFPNHFTLVTGLYPESHGIVGNTFWDPETEKEFYYTDPARSMVPEWWLGEPLWETAELQGIVSAIHMWPGSEAHIGTKEPTYVDKFNANEALDDKVDRILGWLDLPGADDVGATASRRPQFIAAYVPDVDADGHAYGPNSTYIRSTIAEADGMLGLLFKGIDERNLTDIVNIVVVSDHGMATTSSQRMIQLEDLIDTELIEHTDGWPLYGLRPYDHSAEHLQQLYQSLVEKSKLPKYAGSFNVYLRDENMPERYHFRNNHRIAPLWLVPTTGWAIVTRDEFNVEVAAQQNLIYHPRGLHGYDHEHPLMRAIFIARGPAFPHPPGSQVEVFQNIEVYNIICDSLGLTPRPNNGTVRLPFTTIGLHDVDANTKEAIPDDPGEVGTGIQLLPPSLPGVENLPPVPEDIPVAGLTHTQPSGGGKRETTATLWFRGMEARVGRLRAWLSS